MLLRQKDSAASNEAAHGTPNKREVFRRFAAVSAHAVGSPWAFVVAVILLIAWVLSGPIFGFSDTWQLIINTATTIVTFLMVFLIQNTQNRDAKAIHLKLDELIRGLHGPRNKLVDLEDCSDEEIAALEQEFKQFHERHARGDEQNHHRHGPTGGQHQQHPKSSQRDSAKLS